MSNRLHDFFFGPPRRDPREQRKLHELLEDIHSNTNRLKAATETAEASAGPQPDTQRQINTIKELSAGLFNVATALANMADNLQADYDAVRSRQSGEQDHT